jgi:hypothetical protein
MNPYLYNFKLIYYKNSKINYEYFYLDLNLKLFNCYLFLIYIIFTN